MGAAASMSGILCASPNFQLGGAHVGNVPRKISQYLYNTICSNALYSSFIFSKCGITPSGRFLLPYNTSYKNIAGLAYIFNYISYLF